MIGQKNLLHEVDNLITQKQFPRFSLIVGPTGSGKKLLASYMCTESNFFWTYEPDNSIETVRKVIKDAYLVTVPTCYVFTDVDSMSMAAKNALLKIAEEPPNNAHIILTLQDLDMTLPTIKSRAYVFKMEPYSVDEIIRYTHDTKDKADDFIVSELCETPGEVDLLFEQGQKELFQFTEKVVDNLTDVSISNLLKIPTNLSFKPEEKGFDAVMFLKAFKSVCGSRMLKDLKDKSQIAHYKKGVTIVNYYIRETRIVGINKRTLIDLFLLRMQEAWNGSTAAEATDKK